MAKKPIPAQTIGRMNKNTREQYAGNQKIVDRLQKQSNVQLRIDGGADQIASAKKKGMKAAVPSPNYWGGQKKPVSPKAAAADNAYGNYKSLAKKGK